MVTIRKAVGSDLETLLRFEQLIIAAERPFDASMKEAPFHYYDLDDMLQRSDCAIFVAETKDTLVASGSARIQAGKPYNDFKQYAFLGFMYVTPSFRGQGINQRIIHALIEWAQTKGLSEVRLQVYSENERAIKAYGKTGFKPILTEMRLRKDKYSNANETAYH